MRSVNAYMILDVETLQSAEVTWQRHGDGGDLAAIRMGGLCLQTEGAADALEVIAAMRTLLGRLVQAVDAGRQSLEITALETAS